MISWLFRRLHKLIISWKHLQNINCACSDQIWKWHMLIWACMVRTDIVLFRSCLYYLLCSRPLVKRATPPPKKKKNNLISQPKHMLWVLKWTVLMRGLFEHPKYMLELMGKKILTFLLSKSLFIYISLWCLVYQLDLLPWIYEICRCHFSYLSAKHLL